MRILVLGGTVFLGRAVARQALAAGHDVTCAARGSSGDPVDGVRFVRVDRADPAGLTALTGEFDAVVDVARHPDQVRHAVAALAGRVGHFTFVSTGSVYSDTGTVGQRVDTAPLLAPAPRDAEDPTRDPESYGACKVSCERIVTEAFGAERVFVCRAGLLVGPEDPSGRFEYWVRRAGRGGEVLVPGTPEDMVQFVDVRDLAAWIVAAAERGLTGTYDGTGAPMTRAAFLADLLPDGATPTWVSQEFLVEQQVEPWTGPRSLPLWLPLPEYAGFLTRDVTASLAAGLRTRPLAETGRDTADWLATAGPGAGQRIGLTEAEEAELLAAWRTR
ncbi:NAD-dependent epimerase/dehydratase family protein [Plantactinospora endophytica]|uniref:Reductase n=1 Tax=Plantactinospora endophytica TaxID=673535 RepID=A0ABQ4E8Q8_9ACTN|nr:NAD-dependent epimerase/dehydratase family protein [Plantactinospora endophytica]GIG91088.1 reductase [Plantactinospora endophytica]